MKLSRDFKLREERDAELLKDYRDELTKQLGSRAPIVRTEVINKVLKNGRPRYHVSYDYALLVVSRIIRKGFGEAHNSVRREMWREILGHVTDVLEAHPHYTLGKAVAKVLTERRASQYYISKEYAYKLLYGITQSHRNRHRA